MALGLTIISNIHSKTIYLCTVCIHSYYCIQYKFLLERIITSRQVKFYVPKFKPMIYCNTGSLLVHCLRLIKVLNHKINYTIKICTLI